VNAPNESFAKLYPVTSRATFEVSAILQICYAWSHVLSASRNFRGYLIVISHIVLQIISPSYTNFTVNNIVSITTNTNNIIDLVYVVN